MKIFRFLLFLLISLSFSFNLTATNGYFSHGYGTKNKSMAGVATAMPLNTFSASTNPAELVFIGARYDIGLAVFIANRGYTAGNDDGSERIDSDTDFYGMPFFIIPHIGSSFMLNKNMAIGVNMYGNGGMNTNYDKDVYGGGGTPTGVDISQLFLDTNFAYKFMKNQSIGISLVTSVQWVEVKGVKGFSFLSSDAENLSNNGKSYSFGAGIRIGYYGHFMNMFAIGLSYQSEVFMTKFKKYKGLFAEQGGFNIPASINAGISFTPVSGMAIAFDYQRIFYSHIASVSNKMNMTMQKGTLLGDDKGSGFGWDDMNIFKLGIEYKNKNWSIRTGYSYTNQPIGKDDVMFNVLAPAVIEHHLTFGASMKVFGDKEISIAYMHGFNNKVKGPGQGPKNPYFEIEMNQHEIEFEFSF